MDIKKNSNYGKGGIRNFQVLISTKLSQGEISDDDIENIENTINGPFGSITIRQYELSREVKLINRYSRLGRNFN